MKVNRPYIFLSSDFPPVPGGQSRFLFNLWTNLPKEKVIILAPLMPGCEAIDSRLEHKVIRKKWPLGDSLFSKISKTVLVLIYAMSIKFTYPYKGVHCGQLMSAGVVGYLLHKFFKIPYYVYVHGADLLEFQEVLFIKNIIKKILDCSYKIIVNSRFTNNVVVRFGVDNQKIVVLNPGIDYQRFVSVRDVSEIKNRLGLKDKKVIITVSRLVERKGHDVVIQALPQVIKEVSDAHYLIIGDGPYRKVLENTVEELNLKEYVTFLGYVSDQMLPSYYALSDIFVLVSRELPEKGDVEGFGIVYLEANAAKKPVIAGRSGGVEDAVKDGISGILVNPEDPNEIASTIIRLFKNEELRIKLGQSGYRRVRDRFNWKTSSRLLGQYLN